MYLTSYSLYILYIHRYDANLEDAKAFGIRKGLANGLGLGFIYVVFFGAYALAFWYGSKLVRDDEYTVGDMLIVSIRYFVFLFGIILVFISTLSRTVNTLHCD